MSVVSVKLLQCCKSWKLRVFFGPVSKAIQRLYLYFICIPLFLRFGGGVYVLATKFLPPFKQMCAEYNPTIVSWL